MAQTALLPYVTWLHTSLETSYINLGPRNILMQKKWPRNVHYFISPCFTCLRITFVPKVISQTWFWTNFLIHVSAVIIQVFASSHYPVILITSLTLALKKVFHLILRIQSLVYILALLTSSFLASVSWNPLWINLLRTSEFAEPRPCISYIHLHQRLELYSTA